MNKRKNIKMTAGLAFDKFFNMLQKSGDVELLDVGCGTEQTHAKLFDTLDNVTVTTCDIVDGVDLQGKFTSMDIEDEAYDAIWCAHVLEHQENVGEFLKKIHHSLSEDGLLCITVPPLKHNIVGGHLTLWNTGLLYYNLILAGFDCSKAIHKKYNYNISIIVRKKSITDFPNLFYDCGDIELLSKYFPFKAKQGFDGNKLQDTF